MSDWPIVLAKLILENNYEEIRDPAKWLEGAQQSVALVQS
jgi:hypothetical protein